MPDTLYSQADVAAMFGVTIHAVRKWRAQGKIAFIRINETVRFTDQAIADFIRDHHHPAKSCACA